MVAAVNTQNWEEQTRCTWTVTGVVLLWVVLMSGVQTQTAKDPITCQASMSHVATVTCYFPYDLNVTRTDVIVEFFPPKGDHDYAVLACKWIDSNPVPKCYVPRLVNFSYVLTNQVTFTVDPSIAPVGGEFLCGPEPAGDAMRGRCVLKETVVTSTLVPPTSTSSGVCDSCTGCGAPVAGAVILTFILTVLLTVALCVFLLRNAGIPLSQLVPSCLDRFMPQKAQRRDPSPPCGEEMNPMNEPAPTDA